MDGAGPPSYSRVAAAGGLVSAANLGAATVTKNTNPSLISPQTRGFHGNGPSPLRSPAAGQPIHPRMPAPSIQTTVGFVPTLTLSPRSGTVNATGALQHPESVNVLVPRSAKKERATWGAAGPTPPPSAASSMEGILDAAAGGSNRQQQQQQQQQQPNPPSFNVPQQQHTTDPHQRTGTTPWKTSTTPWKGPTTSNTSATPTTNTGGSANSAHSPSPWSNNTNSPWSMGSPSSFVSAPTDPSGGTPGTTNTVSSTTTPNGAPPFQNWNRPLFGSVAPSPLSPAITTPDPDNPWPSNRFASPAQPAMSPLTPSFLAPPTGFPATPSPDPMSPFGFIPSYARPAAGGLISPLPVPQRDTRPEKKVIELVCIVQAAKVWQTSATHTPAQIAQIRAAFHTFPPPDLDLFPASLSDGTHILGVLPTTFFSLKSQLENAIGAELPNVAPSKVEVVLSGGEGFKKEHPYIPARRFARVDEYERYIAGFVSGHNRNLAQQRRRHDAYLHSLRHLLFSHIALARQRTSRLLALDIEAWEMDHSVLIEIGYTTAAFRPAPGVGDKGDGAWLTKGHHLVVEENEHRRNGQRVEDNRDGFLFGTTQILPLKKCLAKLRTALRGADYVVAHAAHSDEKFLRRHGVSFGGKPVLDTQVMIKCLRGTTESLRLSRVLDELGIRGYKGLHNAGNDAYYTMEACLRMGRGPPPPREVARGLGIDWARVVSKERDRIEREREKMSNILSSPTERGGEVGCLVVDGGQGEGDGEGGEEDDTAIEEEQEGGQHGEERDLEEERVDHGEVEREPEDEDGMDVDG